MDSSPIITDDHPDLIKGDVLLQGDAVQQGLYDRIGFIVLGDKDL
jgi:hypothetical protein